MPDRPDWDTYFLTIAAAVATRAECTRRKVGAVVVRDRRIIATGYNGAPAGQPSCLDGACPRGLCSTDQVAPGSSYDTGAGSCIAIHAEANALLHANGSLAGADLYITDEPCDGCARLIAGAGIARAVTPERT